MKKEDRSCKNCRFCGSYIEHGRVSVNKQVVEPRRTHWYCEIMIVDVPTRGGAPLHDFDSCHLWVEERHKKAMVPIGLDDRVAPEEVF